MTMRHDKWHMAKTFATFVLSVGMLFALIPTSAFAETSAGRISKDKSAAWDVAGDTATVKLNIPNPEQTQLDSDVVFVLDKSSCKQETAKNATPLITALADSINNSGAKVNVGVVAFDGTSHDLLSLKEFTGTTEEQQNLTALFAANSIPEAERMGGTNMQAGLVAAEKMLTADTNTPNNRKYVILVSDGLTRLWTGTDGKVKDIYYQSSYSDLYGTKNVGTGADDIKLSSCDYFGIIDDWDQVRNGESCATNHYQVPGGDFKTYYTQVEEWVKADEANGDIYALDYEKYGNDPIGDKVITKNADGSLSDPNFTYIGHSDYKNHAMSVDRAVYEAYNAYGALLTHGYNCYAVNVGSSSFSSAFMGKLNTDAGNSSSINFGDIENSIIFLVDKGTTVTDKIGADFDVVPDTFKVTLDGTVLTCTKTGDGTYSFGTTAEPKQFELTYTSGTDEHFDWVINRNIKNTDTLELSYQVKLVNKKADAGTYEVPTNESATISAVDTAGNPYPAEDFPVPTLSYTVEATPEPEPETPSTPTTTAAPTKVAKAKTGVPNTGDATNAAMPIAIVLCGAAAVFTARKLRSNR